MTILRIDSSAHLETSASRAAVDTLIARLPLDEVITRDVAATPLPHVTAEWADARLVPAADRSAEEAKALALSDTLIAEIKRADTLVIGLPVYNFSLPASLKAWIDLVARPGETFSYTEEGPKGLMTGKRAMVVMASGGTGLGSDYDFASPYLRFVLGFIGITDVTFVAAKEVSEDADAALAGLIQPQAA